MNRQLLYCFVLVLIVLTACQSEDEHLRYDLKESIYFGYSNTIDVLERVALDRYPKGIQDPKKTVYSFAVDMKAVDTVFIPLTISGSRANRERKYKVQVAKGTTAEPALHFAPLQEYYTVPADSGVTYLPIVLFSKDQRLEDSTFVLNLEIVPTEDFDVNVQKHKTAQISFSNRFERPVWWTQWQGELGSYSRVKHALYIMSVYDIEDKDLIPNVSGENGFYIPYNLFLISKFKSLLIDPKLWVRDNPQFALDEVSPGVYKFYNKQNEFKTYRLELDDKSGKYYFVDELKKWVSTDS